MGSSSPTMRALCRRAPGVQRGALGLLLAASLGVGCGGDDGETGSTTTTTTTEAPCGPGELELADGRCQPPGLPLDMPCPPGEAPLEDGSCQAAGVPPSECGDGFTSDGEGGCEPILPKDPCPDGLMAIPGETVCHEVAPCGAGTWGDIPVEANTQFVDGAYSELDSDGSQEKPWKTIQAGVDAAAKGAIVAIAAGTYQENVELSFKPRRLWGRCPSMVTIEGIDPQNPAVQVFVSGAEVRGVGITGPSAGVLALNADPLLVEDVHVHDTGGWGVVALQPSSVTVRGSLLERTTDVGTHARGATMVIERTAVRDVLALGLSVDGYPEGDVRANVTVRSSLLEGIRRTAVNVQETDLVVEGVAIRSIAPGMPDTDIPATGVVAWMSNAAVRQSTIEGLHIGVILDEGPEGLVERVTVADGISSPQEPSVSSWITGILVQGTSKLSRGVIRESTVVRQPEYGITVLGATAVVESTLVRDNVRDLQHESGVDAQEADVTIRRSAILDHAHLGLTLEAASVLLESSVVRGVRPTTDAGDCVAVRWLLSGNMAPSSLVIRSSVIEDCVETGIAAVESDLVMEDTIVRGVKSRADGLFGDGVAVLTGPLAQGSLQITGGRIEETARAGISTFGGKVDIGFSSISCAKFDLVGEQIESAPFSFNKTGDNVCGCPDTTELCKVDSPGIAPPELH